MIEGAYVQFLQKHIRKHCHVFTYKVADRHIPGVPDIYIPGGIWIECKVLKFKSHIDWYKKLSAQQHSFITKLRSGGDRVLCAARCEIGRNTKRCVLIPYRMLMDQHTWDEELATRFEHWGHLDSVLGSAFIGNLNNTWYREIKV